MSTDDYCQNVYDQLSNLSRSKLEELYASWLTFSRMNGREAWQTGRLQGCDTEKTYWDSTIARECAARASLIDEDEHLVVAIYEYSNEMFWYSWRHVKPVLASVSPYGDAAVYSNL